LTEGIQQPVLHRAYSPVGTRIESGGVTIEAYEWSIKTVALLAN